MRNKKQVIIRLLKLLEYIPAAALALGCFLIYGAAGASDNGATWSEYGPALLVGAGLVCAVMIPVCVCFIKEEEEREN